MAKAPEDFDITTKRDKEMRKKKMMNKKHYIKSLVMLATMLLVACGSGSDGIEDNNLQTEKDVQQEIRVSADVWRVMEGTRATTIDTDGALQTTGFKTYVYVDGSTTKYIDGSTVSYADNKWSFDDGKHYWPISESLNFFAHSPKELTNTHCTFDPEPYDAESNPDGYSEDLARIVCTSLPVAFTNNVDATKELVYAYTPAQNKAGQGASGVTMNFKRPFARVYFKLAASHPNITINSITFQTVKNNGSCTFDGTTTAWTPTGDATDLVASYSPGAQFTTTSTVQLIGGPFLVIPQAWTGGIQVNASWTEWGVPKDNQTLSATLPTTWQAGYSYTYTFTITEFDLKVDIAKFTEQW